MKQVGLIGYPVAHSLSPPMQQAAFDALGIEARYTLWETPPGALAERIASLRAPEMLGANVTIPYKEDVVPLLDECDPQAARIGAVNTIINRDGRLVGYNTDAPGFLCALTEAMEPHCGNRQVKKVVILGSGGAARGAAVALLENGVEELLLLGRTAAHVQTLLDHLASLAVTIPGSPRIYGGLLESPVGAQFIAPTPAHPPTPPSPVGVQFIAPTPAHPPSPPSPAGRNELRPYNSRLLYNTMLLGGDETKRFLSSVDVLVNATSAGLKADDAEHACLLIDVNALPATSLVMDMIFNPPQTPLLRAAQAHGCAILNGLSMLLYQGALAFELWTRCSAPLEIMREALGLAS